MSSNRDGMEVNVLDVQHATQIQDGDQLRNINCFEYLKNIASQIHEEVQIYPLNFMRDFYNRFPGYLPEYPYGDLYTNFLLAFEDAIPDLEKMRDRLLIQVNHKKAQIDTYTELLPQTSDEAFQKLFRDSIRQRNEELDQINRILESMDNVIHSVYANPNLAIERSSKMIEKVITDDISHTSSKIEDAVRDRMKGKGSTKFEKFTDKLNYIVSYRDINKTTPQQEGSITGRLKAMVSSTFKPQTTTSLASIRTYDYKLDHDLPVEYRFGTQGQYDEKRPRVSPAFIAWLKVQQRKREANPASPESQKTRITHIYFNNLGLDRSGYEGEREKRLTQQLHDLEYHHDNVAVITLPADKGLMDKHLLDDHAQSIDVNVALSRMLNIATGVSTDPDPDPVKDFYISNPVKRLLYGDDEFPYNIEREREIINNLLSISFEKLGFDERENLTPAEMQAVYFHFIKYELTNFIIEKLKPESFNMSCKDAIDRGGVSSAYYNLMKSLELGTPLSKDEFYRGLHAAPALVKGRGMNHHTRLIWNAVNSYLDSSQPKQVESPEWLVEWRNKNAPTTSYLHIISSLETYIQERSMDERVHHSIIKKHDKETKVNAASKLLALIKDPGRDDIVFESKEWNALHQGRLAKVVDEIKSHGVLALDQFKPSKSGSGLKV